MYYCEFQYKRDLNVERQRFVQVVLLSLVAQIYQDFRTIELLKYGDGDISKGSLVFTLTKSERAKWQTATFTIHKS